MVFLFLRKLANLPRFIYEKWFLITFISLILKPLDNNASVIFINSLRLKPSMICSTRLDPPPEIRNKNSSSFFFELIKFINFSPQSKLVDYGVG